MLQCDSAADVWRACLSCRVAVASLFCWCQLELQARLAMARLNAHRGRLTEVPIDDDGAAAYVSAQAHSQLVSLYDSRRDPIFHIKVLLELAAVQQVV